MPNYTYTTKTNIRIKSQDNARYFLWSVGMLVFVMIIIQLFIMSLYATKGDELAYYEQRRSELQLENKKLSQEIASLRNVENIKKYAENGSYVDISKNGVSYLVID